MCTIYTRVHTLHPGANLHPGAILQPVMSRSYANKLCSNAPRFDWKFNTTVLIFMRNSLCLNVLKDSNSVLSRVVGQGVGGFDISTAECVAETFTLHLYKGQVRKAYS